MNLLIVSTVISAMHCWENAPESRKYLRVPHRHDFQISIRVPVKTSDREYELHDLQDELNEVIFKIAGISPSRSSFGKMSCEQIGEEILDRMSKASAVSVWEDPFHGAETQRGQITGRQIITVCGSTKFKEDTLKVIRLLEERGCIALSVGSFMHADKLEFSAQEKQEFDQIHLDKIRMSHGIFVVNPDGYIGESTRKEIKFARSLGLQVDYMVDVANRSDTQNDMKKFIECMKIKLHENEHKGGWENCSDFELFDFLLEEKNELNEAINALRDNPRNIIDECADVANFAMMIASNAMRRLSDE